MINDNQTATTLPESGRVLPRSPLIGAAAGLLLTYGLGLGFTAVAQEESDPAAAKPIPSQVDSILRNMSDLLATSKGLTLRAEILQDDALDSGLLVQRSSTLEVVISRPGSIHAVLNENGARRELWSDGDTATLFDADLNVFSQTKVPGEIGSILDFLSEKHGQSLPLADLFFENPYQALIGDVGRAFYIGLTEVDGVICHQLAFSQDAIDWQIWIEAGVRPLPRRLAITYKLLPGNPHFMATITHLDLSGSPHSGSFVPILPDDVQEMELLETPSLVIPE